MLHTFALMLKKVVITGPESSGKTTLAKALAEHYRTSWVVETVRNYFEQRTPKDPLNGYKESELRHIAELQMREEDRVTVSAAERGGRVVFCDTDLITIRIWGEEKYGRSDPWVVERTVERHYDLWLLCKPDMPWEPDPLRENPNDRERLFDVYERALKALGKRFIIIGGDPSERSVSAIQAVDRLLH